jgi:adenylyltransferase/sulfurtransferase
MSFREFKVRRNPNCPVCGDKPAITQLIDYEQFCGLRGEESPKVTEGDITAEELKQRLDRGEDLFILDVRNPEEYQICRLPTGVLLPLPELSTRFAEVPKDREVIVHCKSGMRSLRAIQFLKQQGFTNNLRNLKGGILAWAASIDPGMPRY